MARKVLIEIDMSNAAFDDNPVQEVSNILATVPVKLTRQLARPKGALCTALEADDKLFDSNGNTVGVITLVECDD